MTLVRNSRIYNFYLPHNKREVLKLLSDIGKPMPRRFKLPMLQAIYIRERMKMEDANGRN